MSEKTPAYSVNVSEGVKVGGTGLYKHELADTEPSEIGNLAIGSLVDFGVSIETEEIITPKEFTEIMNGKRKWYVFGKLTYSDIFKDFHYTEFCYEFSPKNTFVAYHGKCNAAN